MPNRAQDWFNQAESDLRHADMPVRSLSSSVLKWPEPATVRQALQRWVKEAVRLHPDALLIGYFGSYARADWGVGSDLDLVIVVESSDLPFERRSTEWDTTSLPVPVDVLVYTRAEWEALDPARRFTRMLKHETVWLYSAGRPAVTPAAL